MGHFKNLSLALTEQGYKVWHSPRNKHGNFSYPVTPKAVCSKCGKSELRIMYAPNGYAPMVCEKCQDDNTTND